MLAVDPTHGVRGLVLEEFDWNPETGKAYFAYSHENDEDVLVAWAQTNQPWLPSHEGWDSYSEPAVLTHNLREQPVINYDSVEEM